MSATKNNNTYKVTSFLAGNNSEFINEFYADYLSDPHSLPEGWREFFDGLSDEKKLIHENLKGPSWSPDKKYEKIISEQQADHQDKEKLAEIDLKSIFRDCFSFSRTVCDQV